MNRDRLGRVWACLRPRPWRRWRRRAGRSRRSSEGEWARRARSIPAAPFVAAAYGFIWIALLVYVGCWRAAWTACERISPSCAPRAASRRDRGGPPPVILALGIGAAALVALHLHPRHVHPGDRHRIHAGGEGDARCPRASSSARPPSARQRKAERAPSAHRRERRAPAPNSDILPPCPASSSPTSRSSSSRPRASSRARRSPRSPATSTRRASSPPRSEEGVRARAS